MAGAALLTMLLITPVAFFAGVGRGYLAPMGIAIFFVVLAQVVAAAGWGEYFPWAIPASIRGHGGAGGFAAGGDQLCDRGGDGGDWGGGDAVVVGEGGSYGVREGDVTGRARESHPTYTDLR